jgi:hypothetical protein
MEVRGKVDFRGENGCSRRVYCLNCYFIHSVSRYHALAKIC